MSLVGWATKFENYQVIRDVPERVRKTEVMYWWCLGAAVVMMLAGLAVMCSACCSPFGLFLAIGGAMDIALIKIWAHIRLATYQIIMELQARDRK